MKIFILIALFALIALTVAQSPGSAAPVATTKDRVGKPAVRGKPLINIDLGKTRRSGANNARKGSLLNADILSKTKDSQGSLIKADIGSLRNSKSRKSSALTQGKLDVLPSKRLVKRAIDDEVDADTENPTDVDNGTDAETENPTDVGTESPTDNENGSTTISGPIENPASTTKRPCNRPPRPHRGHKAHHRLQGKGGPRKNGPRKNGSPKGGPRKRNGPPGAENQGRKNAPRRGSGQPGAENVQKRQNVGGKSGQRKGNDQGKTTGRQVRRGTKSA